MAQVTHIGSKHEGQSILEEEVEEDNDFNSDDGISNKEKRTIESHFEKK